LREKIPNPKTRISLAGGCKSEVFFLQFLFRSSLMDQFHPFRTVLLVDDGPTDAFITAGILRHMRLCEQVRVVSSGPQALAYLRAHRDTPHYPDMILLDLCMPGMDGLAFLELALAQNLLAKAVQTVVLTCSLLPADFARAQRYPLAGYLYKPLIPSQLLSALQPEPAPDSPPAGSTQWFTAQPVIR
jgi:CheY-like chemotaxis protein